MSSITSDERPADCDRCGSEIHDLEPVTSIQFSGGVDAFRMICHTCVEDIVDVWNEGDAVGGDTSD